jgi:hypothetical protein
VPDANRLSAATAGAWLGRVDPRADWPLGVVRLGVALCVGVALALGVVYFVHALDRLGDDAGANAAANFDDREFGGGNSLAVDKNALYEARALIRPEETYHVVAGPAVEGANELTEQHIGEYVRYFLMPRRPSPDARWILCYGCDLAQLGSELDVLWRNDAGISLVKLRE